ncbi:hypothetical protein ARALYDRAFT_889103 [Arabidopsis lyrata subsp. lyrata]|uniref:Uncharacterized protein n=1 Tax=Arabidopsis lyrata subsp. lyrata TaxID=81972 RepID=D7KEL6_ARALL|nr:hypothetical protein ARALYDRAFT_889103 [Arabidopsis lyrata subsp. lyrata]
MLSFQEVIFCISLFAINLVFCCFTCFSILQIFMKDENQDFSDLRKNLVEPEEAKPDEKAILATIAVILGVSKGADEW